MATYPCANHDTIRPGTQTGCSVCDVCNSCNVGSGGQPERPVCNVKQTVCTDSPGKGQQANAYGSSGVPSVSRDDIIIKKFNQAKLNALIDWIKKMAGLGQQQTSSKPNISHEDREFIYADKINEVVEALKKVSGENSGPTFSRDDIIYATDFQKFLDAINNMKIDKDKACDLCVSSCNIHCNTCNDCNMCQRSNSGVHLPPSLCGSQDITPPSSSGGHNPCWSNNSWTQCTYCNTCEGCNACEIGDSPPSGSCGNQQGACSTNCQSSNSCTACDSCETCDRCEGCNECQGCDTCMYCNTCLGCNYCNTCDFRNYI